MSEKEQRLLDPGLLPETLWDAASETLRLPPAIARAYRTLIERHGLQELAEAGGEKDSPVGGANRQETDKHFAQRFSTSVARAQLAVIDPKREVSRASNAFIQTLSGNHLCVTDAPCGAGAAAFAFLTTIAELRACDVVPRQPLNVHLIGAEISDKARDYAAEILAELRPLLEAQAIFIEAEFFPWDIIKRLSNTDLIYQMNCASVGNPKCLVVVANISGFLEKKEKRKAAQPQIEELFRYASGTDSVAIWIEPQMNKAIAVGGIFSGIMRWIKESWHQYVRVNTDGDNPNPVLLSDCQFQSPLNPAKTHPVRLAVMRLDLVRSA